MVRAVQSHDRDGGAALDGLRSSQPSARPWDRTSWSPSDCHWKFAVNDVIKLAWDLEPSDLLWLEDPVPPENIDGSGQGDSHSPERRSVPARISTASMATGDLIEKQAADIVAPDIPKMGGLMEARKVADMADTYYIQHRAAQCLQPDRHRGRGACLRGRSRTSW